jgi:hypothetical protein
MSMNILDQLALVTRLFILTIRSGDLMSDLQVDCRESAIRVWSRLQSGALEPRSSHPHKRQRNRHMAFRIVRSGCSAMLVEQRDCC